MKFKYLLSSLIIILGLLIIDGCKTSKSGTKTVEAQKSGTQNTLSTSEKNTGWKLLFDGKNTDQWRGYNRETFPTKGWFLDQEGNLCVTKSGTEEEGL